MNLFAVILVSFLTGVLASLGLGGGFILVIYLTMFAGMGQLQAQGINLVFFIPIAALALVLHTKNKLVSWKDVLPCVITGLAGTVLGTLLANWVSPHFLSKSFAVFVLVIGAKELIASFPARPEKDSGNKDETKAHRKKISR